MNFDDKPKKLRVRKRKRYPKPRNDIQIDTPTQNDIPEEIDLKCHEILDEAPINIKKKRKNLKFCNRNFKLIH